MQKLKWPKRLVIVRHGESVQNVALDLLEENLDNILAEQQKNIRDADIELTDNGIFQAQQTGKYLAKYETFDYCFTSPYIRTIKTAENIISQFDYNLKIYKDNRLREKEFGRLHGYKMSEIKEKYPEEFRSRERDGKYWYRFPGGENYPDVEMRIHSFLDKLNRNHKNQNILIVTHQVVYKSFRTLFGHLGEQEVTLLPETPNCGIQEYINTPDFKTLELIKYDFKIY